MGLTNSEIQIAVASIAAIGVVVAAIIANIDKLRRRPSTPSTPSQLSNGANSPNIANVRGDVRITAPQQALNVPTFSGGKSDIGVTRRLDDSQDVGEFTDFLETHRGRLVHLNVAINPDFSSIPQPQPHERWQTLLVSPSPCETPDNFLPCMGYGLQIRGDEYDLGWYRGHYVFNGYFVIGENSENHQGRWLPLRAVPPANVLLQTQRHL